MSERAAVAEPEGEEGLSPLRSRRRRHILDSAQRTFLREGYHATTMERVAEEAGVSKQTLYNYFADKQDLFASLIEDRKIEEGLPRIYRAAERLAAGDVRPALYDAALFLLEHVADQEMAVLMRLMQDLAPELPEVTARVRERVFDKGHGAIRDALIRGAAAGRLRPVDADVVAQLFFASTVAASQLEVTLFGARRFDIERTAAGVADLFAGGLLPSGQ